MPVNTAPKLIQEFVSLDLLNQTEAALKAFEQDELTKWAISQLHQAVLLTKKDIAQLVKEEGSESGALSQLHKRQDMAALEKTVRQKTTMGRGLLADRGQLGAFQKIKADYKGWLPLAQAVSDLMGKTKGDSMLAMGRKELTEAIDVYKEAESRVSDGGHPTLDPAIAKAARKVWTYYDNAVDVLGIQMRIHNQSYNRVWTLRPTVRTPLRFEALKSDPSLPTPPPKTKKRKPKTKPTDGTAVSDEQKKKLEEEKALEAKKSKNPDAKPGTDAGKTEGNGSLT